MPKFGRSVAVVALAAFACSSSRHSASPPIATVPSTSSVAPTTTAPTSTVAPTSSAPTTSAPPIPTLGRPAGIFATAGVGFGMIRPHHVSNGGDPTGDVADITWDSWGGSQASGTGTSDYVAPNQSVASGTEESVTIVAFQLGDCSGQLMYKAVEWYFPQHGEHFDPTHYEDICVGEFVPPTP